MDLNLTKFNLPIRVLSLAFSRNDCNSAVLPLGNMISSFVLDTSGCGTSGSWIGGGAEVSGILGGGVVKLAFHSAAEGKSGIRGGGAPNGGWSPEGCGGGPRGGPFLLAPLKISLPQRIWGCKMTWSLYRVQFTSHRY